MRRMALIIALGLGTVSLEAAPPSGGGLRGTPGSVTSMRPDGSPRGIPGSVTDPRPRSSVPHHSGNPGNRGRDHDRNPRFGFPYYGYPYDGYPYYYDDDDGDYSNYDQQSQESQQPEPTMPQSTDSPGD